jgi:hypothetical protein
VSGKKLYRRVHGLSWTSDPNTAAWFARRYVNLEDPAVYKVKVYNEEIYARISDRGEKEYVVYPGKKPRRLKVMPKPIKPAIERIL